MNYQKGGTVTPEEHMESLRRRSEAANAKTNADSEEHLRRMKTGEHPLLYAGVPSSRIEACDTLSLFFKSLSPGSKVTIEIGGKPE